MIQQQKDRIKADAKKYANVKIGNKSKLSVPAALVQWEYSYDDYIAGASTEYERARVLVDAIRDIATGKVLPQLLAQQALQKWGKEVEG